MVHKCIHHLHHMNSPLHTCVSVHSRDMCMSGVTLGDKVNAHLKEPAHLQNGTRGHNGLSAPWMLPEHLTNTMVYKRKQQWRP